MRWALILLAVGCPLVGRAEAGGAKKKPDVGTREITLRSEIRTPPVPVAESPQGVVRFSLTADVDARGEGKGTLILDPNRRQFNEFGDVTRATEIAEVKLACALKLVKTRKVPDNKGGDEEHYLYEIQGKKITTRILLMAPSKELTFGRLLIHDKEGKVAFVINVQKPPIPPPCHPGCFPRGTPVLTPEGPRPIDTIRTGEVVTVVRPDGTTIPGRVQSVFVTRNRLLKVTTEGGTLFTTLTQPLCLSGGQFRPAGELTRGEMIFTWKDGKRQTVKVLAVSLTDREEEVFNLVLGGEEVFIAGGFLARSKPPAGNEIRIPKLEIRNKSE